MLTQPARTRSALIVFLNLNGSTCQKARLALGLFSWSGREWLVVSVLLSANVALGLFPQFVIDRVQPTLLHSLPAIDEAETESSGQER